jgi:hypothetical protein
MAPAPADPADPAVLQDTLDHLGGLLDRVFNGATRGDARPIGFVLLAFPFDQRVSQCHYLSNSCRRDSLALLKELIARLEGQAMTRGHA